MSASPFEKEPESDYPTEESPDFEPAEIAEVEAVPVYIVDQEEERSTVGWNGRSVYVDSSRSTQLASKERNRNRLVFLNAGPNTVYIDNSSVVHSEFAFALPADASVELLHNDHVYAVCAATESAVVSVLTEYVTDSENIHGE